MISMVSLVVELVDRRPATLAHPELPTAHKSQHVPTENSFQ